MAAFSRRYLSHGAEAASQGNPLPRANSLVYIRPLIGPSLPHRVRRSAQRRSSFARAHPRFEAWYWGEELFADYLGEPWLRY
jgi:hypothetical protein